MFICCDFIGKTILSTSAAFGMELLFAQSFAKLGGEYGLFTVWVSNGNNVKGDVEFTILKIREE